MAWPTTLTDNDSLLEFAFHQGVTRILEDGNDYTKLHEGASIRVKNWIKANRWANADEVSNPADFAPAAVQWFLYQALNEVQPEAAEKFKTDFYAMMNQTNVEVDTPNKRAGATFAFPRIRKQSRQRFFTSKRSNAIYRNTRET